MTSPESEETSLVPARSSVIKVQIGNREYDMVKHTRCAVCMHPGRFAIEEKLLLNYGYPAIIRFISEQDVREDDGSSTTWPPLTSMQLRNHREKGHVPLNTEMVTELAKRRAAAEGIDLETSMGQYVDHIVITKRIAQIGEERLIKGEIKPEVKDLLAASKILADLEANDKQNASMEQYQELQQIFFQTVQKVVTSDQWQQIFTVIKDHPAVKAYQQKRTIEGRTL